MPISPVPFEGPARESTSILAPNNSLERMQPQREIMIEGALLRRSLVPAAQAQAARSR